MEAFELGLVIGLTAAEEIKSNHHGVVKLCKEGRRLPCENIQMESICGSRASIRSIPFLMREDGLANLRFKDTPHSTQTTRS
jgi:hypothetical protein